jgi:capsule biosynthesis phosphatase
MIRPTIVVDLDGTLCEQTRGGDEYANAAPRRDMIEKVNEYHDRGWRVVIFTARGMNSRNGNVWQAIEDYHGITTTWLYANGVKYHELQFGKPAATWYVDDKGMSPDDFLRSVP